MCATPCSYLNNTHTHTHTHSHTRTHTHQLNIGPPTWCINNIVKVRILKSQPIPKFSISNPYRANFRELFPAIAHARGSWVSNHSQNSVLHSFYIYNTTLHLCYKRTWKYSADSPEYCFVELTLESYFC